MTPTMRTIVALDGQVDTSVLHGLVPSGSAVEIVGTSEGSTQSWGAGDPPPADLLLVACSGESLTALELVRRSVADHPARPVVVLCASTPNGLVGDAFAAGAEDIVVLPESPEKVLFALEKAVTRHSGPKPATSEACPFVCVLGPKGGTGKTLTTANLAVSLAQSGLRTTIVDLDLQFGDVALALGIAPERTVYDLARSGGALDAEKLDAYLMDHPSGVRALLAPTRPDQASAVTVALLKEVWKVLRATNDCVIVDTPPDFTPEVIAAIDASTNVCIVGMLDSLSIKNTKLGLETLALMGYDPGSIRVVLNRADSRVGISRGDVERVLGREPDVLVPSDREVPVSVNEGTPIVLAKPRSQAAAAFRSLAQMYGAPAPARTGRRRLRLRRKARAA
jgi:pilus assembly protein CpaE